MCNFVPGEAIAIGPIDSLAQLKERELPGNLIVRPLVSEVGDMAFDDSPFAHVGTLTLKTDPGSELYAVSQLSAHLATDIRDRKAIVDLNHILPLGNPEQAAVHPLRLSPHAEKEAARLRIYLRDHLPMPFTSTPRRVAVLDSGLAPDYVAHRKIRCLDYSNDGRLCLESPTVDPLGHGTKVVAILDRILPPEIELSVGRLCADAGGVAALNIAHAFGDIVARERPEVVNISVSPYSKNPVCRECGRRVAVPTFLSSALPLVIRLGGRSTENTVTVMAAGNVGQFPNFRWLTDDLTTLVFAVAENRSGDRTRYSCAPEGPAADVFAAAAFGGDDPDDPEAQGVLLDGTYGTSYAAPFVSAAALLSKHQINMATQKAFLGEWTQFVISYARKTSLI